ncbi:50S ribosome-binding GTPase [Candidatus Dojkabacteria bacterium]|nr:50S ribosome-binding GTPase [Candidatus Dojkabacteria bacterium]
MLRDTVKIRIQSGRGGAGSMSTFKNRSTGGDGGRGGKVYILGNENIYDLSSFIQNKTYKAEDGKSGEKKNKTGAIGKDLVLSVPLTTEVIIDGAVAYKITKHGQKELVLKGGLGKPGNISIKRNPKLEYKIFNSEPEKKVAELVLKLKSDIIFIGYPNAGKSSLLNSLTDAKAKTASYAFTTLDPQIGFMDGLKLMDLPGLIEGTHEGKGLGTRFLKHTESAKLVAHFISLENSDPLKVYESLRKEIKSISEELYNKREVIVLTKTDEIKEEAVERAERLFKNKGLEVVSCSIIDDKSIEEVKRRFKELV